MSLNNYQKNSSQNRTVNFHFLTACNMHCKYCFVPPMQPLSLKERLIILEKLRPYFSRINFVGGEPTISPDLIPLLEKAKQLGFSTSIVTNGYNLALNIIDTEKVLSLTDSIGISVDSLKKSTNKKIGRTVYKNKSLKILPQKKLISLCKKIKAHGIKLKINTVISSLNLNEDFSAFYKKVGPDRIKIFQCLKPNNSLKHNYDNLLISSEDFNHHINKTKNYPYNIISENNNEMISAYYMLGSDGCFWDNLSGKKSKCILNVSVEEALNSIFINIENYERRYA